MSRKRRHFSDPQKADAVWRDNKGAESALPNDIHGGTVGSLQYETWKGSFADTAASSALGTAAVPEPTALGVCFLALGTSAICLRMRGDV